MKRREDCGRLSGRDDAIMTNPRLVRLACCALAFSLFAFSAAQQVSNGGFEVGFPGWTAVGFKTAQTSTLGVTPTEGTSQGLLATASDHSINGAVPAGLG